MKNKSETPIDLKKVTDISSFREVYIGNQYKILINKKLGSGSFGDIYLGINLKTKEEIAIKLELVETRTPQLNYESKILKFLQGGEGFPVVHFYGVVGNYNVMIIDLLGPTLEDKFKVCNNKFSLKTVLMLAIQMLNRIEFLHSRHFLHRDIKPENFLLGIGKKKHEIFLIDFGLAKRFRDSKTGDHIAYQDGKSLTGTAIYASIYTHLGIEQCRRDDLESLGYVLMYFLRGDLPWMGLQLKTREEKQQKIMELKINYTPVLLCKGFPDEFINYFNIVREMQFEAKPDYDLLKNLFMSCLKKNNLNFDFNFDWMNCDNNVLKIDLKSELSQILSLQIDLNKNIDESKHTNDNSNVIINNNEKKEVGGGLFGKTKFTFNYGKKEEKIEELNNENQIKIDFLKQKEDNHLDLISHETGKDKEELQNKLNEIAISDNDNNEIANEDIKDTVSVPQINGSNIINEENNVEINLDTQNKEKHQIPVDDNANN